MQSGGYHVGIKAAGAGQEDDAMGRKRYPPDTVDALRAALAQAEPPPRPLSTRQVVAALADDLRAMLAQGWSIDQLVKVLARNQIDLMPTTLQGYLRQPKTAKAAKPRSPAKAKSQSQKEQTPTAAPSAHTVPAKTQAPLAAKAEHEAFDADIELFLDELGPD